MNAHDPETLTTLGSPHITRQMMMAQKPSRATPPATAADSMVYRLVARHVVGVMAAFHVASRHAHMKVATPTVTSGVATATPGATIYYTLNGVEPVGGQMEPKDPRRRAYRDPPASMRTPPPPARLAAQCPVFPASRSSTWGSRGRRVRSRPARRQGSGQVDERQIRRSPRGPARAGERGLAEPCARTPPRVPGPPAPGARRVASGVTSRGPNPVPPVVTTSAERAASSQSWAAIAVRSSGTTAASTSRPASRRTPRLRGPRRRRARPGRRNR